MKIALVILHSDPSRGGAERYTIDLANGLAHRGHEISVIASDHATRVSFRLVALNARGLTRVGQYKRFLRSLADLRRSEPYDVVHAMLPVPGCDVYHPHAGIAAAPARKFNAVFNRRRVAMARVERSLIRDPHGPLVLCLSDYVKGFVRRHYPHVGEHRLLRLFNAVDVNRFAPDANKPPSDWINALIIAQDYERKGLREAIAAVAKVNDPRLRLLVVGKEDPAAYAAQATTLGIADRVVFHPPTASPQEFYRQADFFVLPTKHDPCSLAVLEALAIGLPVISTAQNGACEIMTHGTHGYVLHDPQDVDALASSMRDLCDDARRREMSNACLALRPRLAYEHHLDELLGIYQQVISRRKDARR